MALTFVEQSSSSGYDARFRRFGYEPLGIFRSRTGVRQSQQSGKQEETKEGHHRSVYLFEFKKFVTTSFGALEYFCLYTLL